MTEVDLPLLKRLEENGTLSSCAQQSLEKLPVHSHNKKVYRTGAWYVGDLTGSQRNGWGQFKWTNGRQYEGHYVNNKRHGEGTYTWKDGTIYHGTFKEDLRDGYGTLSWDNQEKYCGDFCNDMRHGQGIYTWPDGRKYEGSFLENIKSGYGVFTMSNGNIFEGIYENDIRFGPGILSYATGNEQDVGIWKGNMIIKLCTVIPDTFLYSHFHDHFVNAACNQNNQQKNKITSALQAAKFPNPNIAKSSELVYPDTFPFVDIVNGLRHVHSRKGHLEKLSEELLHAASVGDVNIVKDILNKQLIDPNVSDKTGSNPVLIAAVNCHLNVLNTLLDYGADINQLTNEGLSALSACHLLLYTEESFLPNIADHLPKENLFNTVEIEKRTGTIINRNDRKAILQMYESITQYGLVNKRKKTGKSSRANKNQTKRRTIMARETESSSKLTKLLLGEYEEIKDTVPSFDQWKVDHYQKSMDHVRDVEIINRTFKEFMLKPFIDPEEDDEILDYLEPYSPPTMSEAMHPLARPITRLNNDSIQTSLLSIMGYQAASVQKSVLKIPNNTQVKLQKATLLNVERKKKRIMGYQAASVQKSVLKIPNNTQVKLQKTTLLNVERKPHLLQTIKLLLRRGVDPNASDLPMPSLFFAVKCADADAVATLLEQNADTTATTKDMVRNVLKHFDVLQEKGTSQDVDVKNQNLSPLHVAVALPVFKGIQITKLLLRHGADPNGRDSFGDGRTPLHIVCCREDDYKQAQKITRMLLDYNADPNLLCQGNSALSLAIASGNDLIVDTLLKCGANVSFPLTHGLGSALCVATTFQAERHRAPERRQKLIEKLVDYGADLLTPVRVSDKYPPCTVVDYAYHVFMQDRRIACTPYHALSSLEREIYNSRKHLLEVLGGYLRKAALKKEEDLAIEMRTIGLRESTLQLLHYETTHHSTHRRAKRLQKKPRRLQQDGGRDETCGLRYVIVKVSCEDAPEGFGFRKKLRYCYECGRSIGVRLTPCTRCKEVFYCSKNCKIKAWNLRHRDECSKMFRACPRLKHEAQNNATDVVRPTTAPPTANTTKKRISESDEKKQQAKTAQLKATNYNRSFFPKL